MCLVLSNQKGEKKIELTPKFKCWDAKGNYLPLVKINSHGSCDSHLLTSVHRLTKVVRYQLDSRHQTEHFLFYHRPAHKPIVQFFCWEKNMSSPESQKTINLACSNYGNISDSQSTYWKILMNHHFPFENYALTSDIEDKSSPLGFPVGRYKYDFSRNLEEFSSSLNYYK